MFEASSYLSEIMYSVSYLRSQCVCWCFLLVGLLCPTSLTAQVGVTVTPSGRHADAIQKTRTTRAQLKVLRQQAKAARQLARQRKQQVEVLVEQDSLSQHERDSLEQQLQQLALAGDFDSIRQIQSYYMLLSDSSTREQHIAQMAGGYLPPDGTDSLDWAMHILAEQGQYEELRLLGQAVSGGDSTDIYAQLAESLIPEDVKEALTAQVPELPVPQSVFPDLPEEAFPHTDLEELASKIPEADLTKTFKRLGRLKNKYSSIPDIRYPKQGVKRSSLDGQGLSSRIGLGGNLAITSTDPVRIDVHLMAGFRINKNWMVGSSVRWQESLSRKDSLHQPLHGYSGFTRYIFYSHFFAYGEWATVRPSSLLAPERWEDWQYQYLAGVGREIQIAGALTMTTTLLYDFNHKRNDVSRSPWSLRVGVMLQKSEIK